VGAAKKKGVLNTIGARGVKGRQFSILREEKWGGVASYSSAKGAKKNPQKKSISDSVELVSHEAKMSKKGSHLPKRRNLRVCARLLTHPR